MNIQDVPNKASFMEDKNLNDHLLITIFCYLDITTLLKSVNVTCKEFNVLLRSPISSGLIWSKHWPYSISYGYNVNMEEEEEEEESVKEKYGRASSQLPSWSGNLDYESFCIFRNLEVKLLKLLSSSISGFEYSRARSSSTLAQVMVFIRQHIGLEHLTKMYHYDEDNYNTCHSLSGLPGLVDVYSINKSHLFSIGQRRFISGCLVAFLNLLTNLINLLDLEVDLYSDVMSPESFVDLSSETLFKGNRASIIKSLCHLGGSVEQPSLFAHFIKPPVPQRGFSAEEVTQLRSLMAKALTYVKSVEHARRWDIILACRQKGDSYNNNDNSHGNPDTKDHSSSNNGIVEEGQDAYLIEGFHCIGQIKNNYQRDFVNHIVATTATLVWRELLPDLFPENDPRENPGWDSGKSSKRERQRSYKVDVLYQHILNPEQSNETSKDTSDYRAMRSHSNERERRESEGNDGFMSLSRRESLTSATSEGSVKEGCMLDAYHPSNNQVAYSSGYAYYEDSWTRMRSEISHLSAQVLFRVKMLSSNPLPMYLSHSSHESKQYRQFDHVLTCSSFHEIITYMREHSVPITAIGGIGEEGGSLKGGRDVLGRDMHRMFTSQYQTGILDRFANIRIKLRETIRTLPGKMVIQCIIDKIYGTHENFSTRTADSRNEDATVDARSSRRRDRSMSLGSSISSDGEDDQGGPALNMSSPSHSSYYVSTNSYLDTSIYTKMGIPITLSTLICLVAAEVGLELIQDQRDINEVNNDNASSGHTRTTSSGEETEVAMEGGEGNSSTSKLYVVGMRGHVITGFYDPMSRLRDLNNPYSTLSSQSQGTVRGEGSEGEMVKDCLYIDPFEPHELMTATQVFRKFPFLQHNYHELLPTADIETWLRVMRNLLHVEMRISSALHTQMFRETMPTGILSTKHMVGGMMGTVDNKKDDKDDKDADVDIEKSDIYTLPHLSSALKAHLLVTDSDCRKYLLRLQSEILTEQAYIQTQGQGVDGNVSQSGGEDQSFGVAVAEGESRVYMTIAASLMLIRERLQAAISLGLPYAIEDIGTQLMYSDLLTAGGLPSPSSVGTSATNSSDESCAVFMRDKPVYKQLKEMLSKAKIREASISV